MINYYEDGHEELYNLKDDLEERHDIASEHPQKMNDLHASLFDYLNEVGARFPEKDPQYQEEQEKAYLEKVKTVKLPQLEKQRMEMLSKDFAPAARRRRPARGEAPGREALP